MISKMLRTPLITSAILLVIMTVIVYLTAASPEGSIFGSIGTLLVAVFRFIQLSVGLIIALLFCLAVLIGIFLGGVALISRESAGKMFEKLHQEISDKLLFFRSMVIREAAESETGAAEGRRNLPGEEVFAAIEGSVDMIREDQTVADRNIEWLLDRVERLENNEELTRLSSRLAAVEKGIDELIAGRDDIMSRIDRLQTALDELSQQAGENTAQPVEKLNDRVKSLDERLRGLAGNIEAVQSELSGLQEGVSIQNEKEQGDEDGEEHRIFAYVKNKAMQEKIEQLVTETLDTDMSYAQVIEHLVGNTGKKTGEIIEAHPSLTEDYIRYRRKNG